jgi:WD40 repeat protein/nucleoside phosphorylase
VTEPLKLQVGGAVNLRKAVYIVRPTDDELLELLERGEYCNVLCSRQMGKTSLLNRTRGRLDERGIHCAMIDVAGHLGRPPDADTWYHGLLQELGVQLKLEVDVDEWWASSRVATLNQRLLRFFREEILLKLPGRVVLILDEIDQTLSLPFTDDFFVAIRSMYNDRTQEPTYERLTFCLVGVATPNELIKNRRTTPYNVGRTIELGDFDPTRDDLGPLYRAVAESQQQGEAIVQAFLRWTGGHPYLTVRLCNDFARARKNSAEEAERLVEEAFPSLEAVRTDSHFEQVLRFIDERIDDPLSALTLYRRIRQKLYEPDSATPAHIQLKLAGLVKRQDGQLVVRNRIYERVFTDRWARSTSRASTAHLATTGHAQLRAGVDALIITALLEELEAVLSLGEGGSEAWTMGMDVDGSPFHYREFPREEGLPPLRIAVASLDGMGEPLTRERVVALIKYLDPACLAACGICAGKRKDVALGDVIVADRVYSYDQGKFLAGRDRGGNGAEEYFHDIKTYNLAEEWRVDAAYFARELDWAADLVKARPPSREAQERWLLHTLLDHEERGGPAPDEHPDREELCPAFVALWDRLRLPEHGLLVNTPGVLALTEKGKGYAKELARKHPKGPLKDREFKLHIGPIATGMTLQPVPDLFDRLGKLVRKTLGAEMEASAIGMLDEQRGRPTIIVKAVSDYGDGDKDEAFRTFAARASAEVLIRFLLRRLEPVAQEIDDTPIYFHGADFPRGDDLLSRVQRIIDLRVREIGVTVEIHRLRAPPPLGSYLRVSRVQGPLAEVFPVAAVEQLTAEVLDAFLIGIDARYRQVDPSVRSTLVYAGDPPPGEVVSKAAERRVLLQSFTEYQGLVDFRSYLRRQIDLLTKDPIYPPELYVEQRATYQWDDGEVETADALNELIKMLASPYGRFVLVLGDFGTGKTFLLRELARRMALAGGPLTPVLIEMRALEKASQLDVLIAQHFSIAGMERIDLPALRYLLAEGRIALLFDGFDELALRVSYERATEHFSTLIQAAQGEAKIIVTSRTQHFFSDQQVKLALAEQASSVKGYRLTRLKPFSKEQIQRFLVKRLGSEEEAANRFRLLDEVKDLLGLSANPRLLGFITEIPEHDLLEARERNKTITSALLYELLLKRWLVNEFQRAHPKGTPPGLDLPQRWKAVTDLAMLLWQRTARTINLQELPEEMIGAVKALATHEIEPGVVRHQIGSGTLLIRDEDGNFTFIHQSVMEWLVAKTAAGELIEGRPPASLGLREITPLMADFVWGLAGRAVAEEWAQRTLSEKAGEILHLNALRILARLGVQAQVGLRLTSLDLRGQDLSQKDLRHADLSGADLTGASLVGADLTGATLRQARLHRADLSKANLERADLRDSDMLASRLLGTHASQAMFAGARLREAKLIGARLDPHALDGCDLFGAAMPEGGNVVPMVSAVSRCHAVAFSPDGRLLATSHTGSIQLWDVESGTERRTLQGHEGFVWSVAFGPDGETLASGSSDTTVRLWDVSTGAERCILRAHSQDVLSVVFGPDGRTLASSSEDRTVRLWDISAGTAHRVLEGHSLGVRSVAFAPDGKTLASGGMDHTVRLWDIATGTQQRVLKGHSQGVWNVAFSPDNKMLASGSLDRTVRLWEAATGFNYRVIEHHYGSVSSVAFAPDGRTLASGSNDSTVCLWDVRTGARSYVLRGHSGEVRSVAFSPDGKTLASGAMDRTVCLWDISTGTQQRVLKGHSQGVRSVAFAPDGRTLACGSDDHTVHLWDITTGAGRCVFRDLSQNVRIMAFAPDGRTLACGSNDRTVRLWDVSTGVERHILRSPSIASMAFTPDGKTLASGSHDSTVHLWDVSTGGRIRILRGHSHSVWGMAFTSDGKMLASGSEDNSVSLWDVSTGDRLGVLRGHSNSIWSVAFTHDGEVLASGSMDYTVRLWGRSGYEFHILKSHSQGVLSVVFTPDGKTLASGSLDTTVRLWDVATGRERRVLRGHSQSVRSVAFSPDGKTLASGSEDNTTRLWDVATGDCLAVFLSLPEGWVAFTPDGRYRSAGDLSGAFWHAIGLCRFEPGELDSYLPTPLRVPDHEPLWSLPR